MTKKSKYSIGNINENNIIHFESSFADNSSGGTINVSYEKTGIVSKKLEDKKEAKDSKSPEELTNILDFPESSQKKEKEQQTIAKLNNFLQTKKIFLETRDNTIKLLQDCCNNLEGKINLTKYAKIGEVGEGIESAGNAFSIFTLGTIKALGGIIKTLNNKDKRNELKRRIKEFNEHLINNEEKSFSLLRRDYNSLIEIIKENQSDFLSKKIVELLQLKLINSDKIFNRKYNVFQVLDNIWENKKYLSPEEMKKTIGILTINHRELDRELDEEMEKFDELKKTLNMDLDLELQALVEQK